jgi:long-subunit fatty acid transport protein
MVVAALAGALLLLLLTARATGASGLLQMSSGPADMAVNGAAIAKPLSPSGALFANPAGLAGFSETTVSSSIGIGFGHERIHNSAGYDEDNDVVAMIPDAAVSFAGNDGWHYGVGLFGSVGLSYDFPADPAAGVDSRFYSECSIGGLPIAVAKRVNDRLWLGAELTPMLGYMRNIYHGADGQPFHYKLIGPGIQGMVGATWRPHERWSLGLGVRTPGRVWMDGSDENPSGGRQNVDLEVKLPTEIGGGVEVQATPTIRVLTSLRWTDSSTFGDSRIDFGAQPSVRPAFVPDASDEWRIAAGLRYAWAEAIELRAGIGYSNRIVGTSGVNPLVFDNNHVSFSVGAGYTRGVWTLDFMVGVVPLEHRHVGDSEALALPGEYESGGAGVLVGLQRRF